MILQCPQGLRVDLPAVPSRTVRDLNPRQLKAQRRDLWRQLIDVHGYSYREVADLYRVPVNLVWRGVRKGRTLREEAGHAGQ